METELSFIGMWFTPNSNDKAPGKLHLDLQLGKYALEFSKPREENETYERFTKEDRVFPLIYGIANSGENITLLNCFLTHRSDGSNEQTRRYLFYVGSVIIGDHCLSTKPKFSCFIFDHPELVAWTNLCHFEATFYDKDYDTSSFSYNWIREAPVFFQLNENLTVKFNANTSRVCSHVVDPLLNVSQTIEIQLLYYSPVALSVAWDDYHSLIRLINIGFQSNITNNKVKCLSCNTCISNETIPSIEVYISHPHPEPIITKFYDFIFNLHELQQGIISTWTNKQNQLQSIVDFYLNVISSSTMYIENRFLNLVQALEIYHTRFQSSNKVEYAARIESMLASIPLKNRDFHTKRLKPKSYTNDNCIKLIHRLSDLYVRDPMPKFCTMENKVWPYSYIEKIVETRNYLTHYNLEKETSSLKGVDLVHSLLCLQSVLEYYLLKELGLSVEVQTRLLKSRNIQISLQRNSINFDS